MCKQHTLYFACGHKITSRLSTCNFKVTGPYRDGSGRYKACMSYSYIARDIPGLCSNCYLKNVSEQLDFDTEAIRLGMIGSWDSAEIDAVELEKVKRIESLAAILPKRQGYRQNNQSGREMSWQHRRSTGRKTSLLRTEVKWEEIVGHNAWEKNVVSASTAELVIEENGSAWPCFWDDSDEDAGAALDDWIEDVDSGSETDGSLFSQDDENENENDSYHVLDPENDNDSYHVRDSQNDNENDSYSVRDLEYNHENDSYQCCELSSEAETAC